MNGKWTIRKWNESWWTFPPGEDHPDETWRTWGRALAWVNTQLSTTPDPREAHT